MREGRNWGKGTGWNGRERKGNLGKGSDREDRGKKEGKRKKARGWEGN